MNNKVNLNGTGAWYCRVSDEKQELDTQRGLIHSFLERHKVSIQPQHRYEDLGLARDMADLRPRFQAMMKQAESGAIKWIVITTNDRFGTKDEWELASYIFKLREAGCNLYLIDGTCLTDGSFATFVTAGVAGAQSSKEQRDKAERSLKGARAGVERGEWQGGHIPYGLDVVCTSQGKELWRVVLESHGAKVKLSPNGESKTYPANVFPGKDDSDLLQLRPTVRTERLAVVRKIFHLYTTQAITFQAIARQLNELHTPHTYADTWAYHHIRDVISNPIYIGKQRYGFSGGGRHLEWDAEGKGFQPVEKVKRFDPASGTMVWRRLNHRRSRESIYVSKQMFTPIIPTKVWELAQSKLDSVHAKNRAPRKERLWLTGLLYCTGCGQRMRGAHADQSPQYVCSTYMDKKRFTRMGVKCTCGRNAIAIEVIESTIKQWLKDTGNQLAIFKQVQTTGDLSLLKPFRECHLQAIQSVVNSYKKVVNRVNEVEPSLDQKFMLAIPRLNWNGTDDNLVEVYNQIFATEEIGIQRRFDKLDLEIAKLTESWIDLPTPRAKAHAKARLEGLEAELGKLRERLQNHATVYEALGAEVASLAKAFADACTMLANTESPYRQKGQAVRQVINRINATFSAGRVELEIVPMDGNPRKYAGSPNGVAAADC